MSKICPNCEKENPSVANYCMFCNTQLVEEEQLSEEDKLRKELSDANEIILLQKKHLQTLEDSQLKTQDDAKFLAQSQIVEKKEEYEQKIAKENIQYDKPISQLEDVKKNESKSNWGWISLVLCVFFLLVLFVIVYFDKENNSIVSETGQFDNDNQEFVIQNVVVEAPVEEVSSREELSYNSSSDISGRFPQASERLLSSSDLSGLSKYDLKIMRNEIFARHGYIFQTNDMKNYFQNQFWYSPQYNNVNSKLTNIERENIALIKSYE